jgi:hypothetical protein
MTLSGASPSAHSDSEAIRIYYSPSTKHISTVCPAKRQAAHHESANSSVASLVVLLEYSWLSAWTAAACRWSITRVIITTDILVGVSTRCDLISEFAFVLTMLLASQGFRLWRTTM